MNLVNIVVVILANNAVINLANVDVVNLANIDVVNLANNVVLNLANVALFKFTFFYSLNGGTARYFMGQYIIFWSFGAI